MLILTASIIALLIWAANLIRKSGTHEVQRPAVSNEDVLAKAQRMAAMAEALQQSKVMGDDATTEAINDMTYSGRLPQRRADGAWTSIYDDLRILKITGMKYRGDLSAYIGHFRGMLVPEPTNEYDNFAIMVKVEDGRHVGYIKEDQTPLVRWLVGAEQPLGEDKPTTFKPYKIEGDILEAQDEDGRAYIDGYVYIKKAK